MKSLEEKNSLSLKKSHREETLTKEIERSCFKNILSNVHSQFCKEFLAVLGQLCTCLTGLERVLERGSQSKPEAHKFNQPPCCLCNFLLQRTFLWSEVTTLTPQAILLTRIEIQNRSALLPRHFEKPSCCVALKEFIKLHTEVTIGVWRALLALVW